MYRNTPNILTCVSAVLVILFACNRDSQTGPESTLPPESTFPPEWTLTEDILTDPDGNTYRTVTIGTQTWTEENLQTTTFNDGTSIPYVADAEQWSDLSTPGCCAYNDSIELKDQKYFKWGLMYNWYAVTSGKLAPEGWHVPTDTDWTALESYLIANGYNWDSTTTGNKIAQSLTIDYYWQTSETPGTPGNYRFYKHSGFSASGYGYREYHGVFLGLFYNCCWWSATESDTLNAFSRKLYYHLEYLSRSIDKKVCGYYIRLVRDN
jgi:uncharacterized protein (TIGR02145 family)